MRLVAYFTALKTDDHFIRNLVVRKDYLDTSLLLNVLFSSLHTQITFINTFNSASLFSRARNFQSMHDFNVFYVNIPWKATNERSERY